jgi:hypothetical protein
MRCLKRFAPALLFLFFLALPASAQQANPKPSAPAVDDALVQKQFGSTCKLIPGPQPLTGDLDGDGIEDLVVVAHCTNPLLDTAEDHFQLIDPYNTFYGYGDTKITSQFGSEDPLTRGLVLLVIHGAGPEAWRAATPKAKFVIINLPFKQVIIRKLTLKKKVVLGIYAEESGADNMTSVVYWDGKKYRYAPLGSGME